MDFDVIATDSSNRGAPVQVSNYGTRNPPSSRNRAKNPKANPKFGAKKFRGISQSRSEPV